MIANSGNLPCNEMKNFGKLTLKSQHMKNFRLCFKREHNFSRGECDDHTIRQEVNSELSELSTRKYTQRM